ncbi:hypothetical protein [Lewinella sp. IMCC34183]|uniref:hypothetical protein n=1 Tax=Lewinella sp. IMCC34183 TaxID=2248762 RepID=UPI000E257D64|nr:hypothetical protein [Lewinella sp. IMCC34183]
MRLPGGSRAFLGRLALAGGALLLLTGITYAGWYLLQDYDSLRAGYLAGEPFYRSTVWDDEFFTPLTKQRGNGWCLLVIAAGLPVLYFIYRRWRRGFGRRPLILPFGRADLPYLLVQVAVQAGLWGYAVDRLPLAYDEAFSAVHAAGVGPWRALSYYMLPNNHLLFNVINGALFGWTGDLVATGRLLSLLSLLVVGGLQYGWLRGLLGSRAGAVATVLLVSATLPVWGFAAQARGYGLLYLFSWMAVVGLWRYRTGGGAGALALFSLGCVGGYASVPVFLYVHLALLVWIGLAWLSARSWAPRFLRWQVATMVAVLVFHLPALTYSGDRAFVANRYVSAVPEGLLDFALRFLPTVPGYLNYISPEPLNGWPFLLPLVLLAAAARGWLGADQKASRLATLWILLWLAVVFTAVGMRAVPFHRTLPLQASFGLVFLIVSLARQVGAGTATVTALLGTSLLVARVPAQFNLHLYYYDMAGGYRAATELLEDLPAGSPASFSDEAFYPRYLWEQRESEGAGLWGGAPLRYYVTSSGEPLPPEIDSEALHRVGDYLVFRVAD